MRVRTVTCMHIEGHPAAESRCQERRPIREELCDMGSCATGWFFTDWPQKVRNLLSIELFTLFCTVFKD